MHRGLARATTPTPACRRRQATRAVGARAKRPRSGDNVYAQAVTPAPARERMRAGDNTCAWTTTHAPGRQHLRPCDDGWHVGGVFFHKHPKLQHSCNDVCVRVTTFACTQATMSAPVQRRVLRGRGVFSQHPKLQRSGDDICVRATTVAHGQQRPCSRDDVWILLS